MKSSSKKRTPKQWKGDCDRIITNLFKGKPCAICGSLNTCGHHIVPRSRSSFLRHDLQNIISLCPTHHMFSNEIAPHSTNSLAVHAFVEFIKEKFPNRYSYLLSNQHTIQKPDWKAAYERLKNETENCTDT